MVVVDHDRKRLVWAHEGRDEATLDRFFFELGPERSKLITHVSADGASWIANVVALRCPNAIRCLDPFHVVAWATEALDEIRREVWNTARRAARGSGGTAPQRFLQSATRAFQSPTTQARPRRADSVPCPRCDRDDASKVEIAVAPINCGTSRPQPVGPLTFSVPEAARLLGINRNTAYELAARGQLPTIRLGKRVLVVRVALERLLNRAGSLAED